MKKGPRGVSDPYAAKRQGGHAPSGSIFGQTNVRLFRPRRYAANGFVAGIRERAHTRVDQRCRICTVDDAASSSRCRR